MEKILGVTIFAYPFLQFFAIQKTERWWRIFAALPLIPMVYVIIETIKLFNQDSNLWPIMLIFTAPIAVLYLGLLMIIHNKLSSVRLA